MTNKEALQLSGTRRENAEMDSLAPSTPRGTERGGLSGVCWRDVGLLLGFVVFLHVAVAAVLLPNGLPLCYWPIGEARLLLVLLVSCVAVGAGSVLVCQIGSDMLEQVRGGTPVGLSVRLGEFGRLVVCGWGLGLVYAAALIAYVNLKTAVPVLNPNSYDGFVESWERVLCGGVFPTEWLISRTSAAAARFWDFVYGLFALVLFVSLMIAVQRRGLRGGARLVLALCVGLFVDLVVTVLWPTRGPLFVHPEWFGALDGLSSSELAAFLLMTVEEYAAEPGRVYACSGISAMPSYHVFGWTCAILCWGHLPRLLVAAGWALAVLNWVSTVVLGWHYLVDGAVAILLAMLVWWATGRLMFRRRCDLEDA